MKKIVLTASVLMMVSSSIAVAKEDGNNTTTIDLEYHKNNHPDRIHRMPFRLDILAWYDSLENSIYIESPSVEDAEVYVIYGNTVLHHSTIVNTIIYLPLENGIYQIEIKGDNWSAFGVLEL